MSFSYVWSVPTLTAGGEALRAALHGGTGKLLDAWDPNPWSGCSAQTQLEANGDVIPQNQIVANAIGSRPIRVTLSDQVPGYSWESHSAAITNLGQMIPEIYVMKGEDVTAGDQCTMASGIGSGFVPGNQYYHLMPIHLNGNAPTYNETSVHREAGDAHYMTVKTMETLWDWASWNGFDGQGGLTKIVVDTHGYYDEGCADVNRQGDARYMDDGSEFAPFKSVSVCPSGGDHFAASAALDLIAHEWGHGVLFERDIVRGAGDSPYLHEGFADVLGYAVEWYHQPPVADPASNQYTYETADWAIAEDARVSALIPAREVHIDDESGSYSYHADDIKDVCNTINPHYCGNRLSVALRLAAIGGENPVCIDQPNLAGCGGDSVAGMPVATEAAKIEMALRIFLRVMTVYYLQYDHYEDLADEAKLAAHDLYSTMADPCAIQAQDSVQQAFSAIGHGGNNESYRYCF